MCIHVSLRGQLHTHTMTYGTAQNIIRVSPIYHYKSVAVNRDTKLNYDAQISKKKNVYI